VAIVPGTAVLVGVCRKYVFIEKIYVASRNRWAGLTFDEEFLELQ
jgi:hypothetical protein